jgi:phosphohistidine swiveling domain-containing protein
MTTRASEAVTFGTKAETLARLAGKLAHADILPQHRFTVGEWQSHPAAVLGGLLATAWAAGPLIVRSSALIEDADEQSLAGHFASVAHVTPDRVGEAIDTVVASYSGGEGDNQVFIQPMLAAVRLSGVACSRDPATGAPYVVINYDDQSASTSSVTAGGSNDLRTFVAVKWAGPAAGDLALVMALLQELEALLDRDALDIEFAFVGDALYLLQVRPLVLRHGTPCDADEHRRALARIRARVAQAGQPHPHLYGRRTVFGVMPDWNPAEIIGVRPRPLALSLYKDLITDSIWAYQRDNYGYRNLRSFPLLVHFFGLPYIDVRVSFNSFLPADVSPDLSEKLVTYYIDRLIQQPSHHDKVEFEIIYSCYTLDLPERLQRLADHGFGDEDIARLADSLRRLTNGIIHGDGLWVRDAAKIQQLTARREQILSSDLDDVSRIYWLLEDCKRYGTLPFAGLARAGFIAVQMLKSLISVGILTPAEYDRFMGSLNTVSSQMGRDCAELSPKAFLVRYGHLRPGTYDLLSPRYDEAPDRYFDWSRPPQAAPEAQAPFALSLQQLKRIEQLLKQHQLDHDVIGFFDFIKGAIEGREYAKFVFTQNLSTALVLFGSWAEGLGFSREQASYANIDIIRRLYSSSDEPDQLLRQSIASGEAAYRLTQQVNLPPLITAPDDVLSFELPRSEPNFVTRRSAVGRTAVAGDDRDAFEGAILLIPSADPGYDWIFARGIAGFITMYGGANSHMAIRAAELGIPAVIGAGETLFTRWASARKLEIDCANRQVRVLS